MEIFGIFIPSDGWFSIIDDIEGEIRTAIVKRVANVSPFLNGFSVEFTEVF